MTKRKTTTTIDEVVESISNVVDPVEYEKLHEETGKRFSSPKLTSLKFWCVSCEKTYEIFKKDKEGKMEEQQICTHMTFKGATF